MKQTYVRPEHIRNNRMSPTGLPQTRREHNMPNCPKLTHGVGPAALSLCINRPVPDYPSEDVSPGHISLLLIFLVFFRRVAICVEILASILELSVIIPT